MVLEADVDGPFGTGIYLGSMLSGVIVGQAYEYMKMSSNDGKYLRALVTILVLLTLVNTVTNFATLYDHFILNPGPENVFYTSRLFHVNFYLAPFISGAVQLFFIYRLWVVSRNSILIILTSVLALLCFISSLIVPALISSTLALNRAQIQDFILFSRWSSVLVDVVISVAFGITTFKTTRDFDLPGGYIVVKLFHMCLQCAVFTASLAFANAICTSFDNNYFKSQGYTAFLISPAYVSSLLYVLNARRKLQELSNRDRPLTAFPLSSSTPSENDTTAMHQVKLATRVTTTTSSTKSFGDFSGVTNTSRTRPSFGDSFNQHLRQLTFTTGEHYLRRGSAISDSSGTVIQDMEEINLPPSTSTSSPV